METLLSASVLECWFANRAWPAVFVWRQKWQIPVYSNSRRFVMQHNNPTIFSYQLTPNTTQAVRVIKKGEESPWFVARDICMVLGLHVTSTMERIKDNDKEKRKLSRKAKRPAWLVSLSGVHTIVRTSDAKKAKNFRKWLESNVLNETQSKSKPYSHHAANPNTFNISHSTLSALLQDAKRAYTHNSQALAEHRAVELEMIHCQKTLSGLFKAIHKLLPL